MSYIPYSERLGSAVDSWCATLDRLAAEHELHKERIAQTGERIDRLFERPGVPPAQVLTERRGK